MSPSFDAIIRIKSIMHLWETLLAETWLEGDRMGVRKSLEVLILLSIFFIVKGKKLKISSKFKWAQNHTSDHWMRIYHCINSDEMN